MPIVINGNGTITGLAVGGLPDGSVDRDTLATTAKGSILQVTQESKHDSHSTTSTSHVEISSDLRASFSSLASTSSKVLVTLCLYLSQADNSRTIRIYRDIGGAGYNVVGNSTATGTDDGSFTHYGGGGGQFLDVLHFTWLDSPNTTSAVTYTPYWKTSAGTAYLNRGYYNAGDHEGVSTVTLQEIAA